MRAAGHFLFSSTDRRIGLSLHSHLPLRAAMIPHGNSRNSRRMILCSLRSLAAKFCILNSALPIRMSRWPSSSGGRLHSRPANGGSAIPAPGLHFCRLISGTDGYRQAFCPSQIALNSVRSEEYVAVKFERERHVQQVKSSTTESFSELLGQRAG